MIILSKSPKISRSLSIKIEKVMPTNEQTSNFNLNNMKRVCTQHIN